MDKIKESVNNAIERYFNALSKFGYKSYNDVNKLLVLLLSEELICNDLSYFVNECDYRSITNVLYCISGNNCLIDLPTYDVYDNIYHKTSNNVTYRITEDFILRQDEDDSLRIIE